MSKRTIARGFACPDCQYDRLAYVEAEDPPGHIMVLRCGSCRTVFAVESSHPERRWMAPDPRIERP